MARAKRIEFPGAIYHVLQRGFRRERIFADEKTKWDYLNYLNEFSIKYNVEIYACCLMGNHVHLLLCTQQANLSKFMHSLNASFANSRKRYGFLDGAVFAGRYKALLVDSDAWLLQVSAYIHLNPVRARMVKTPGEYDWSSYKDYFVSPEKRRFGLSPENVLSLFGGDYSDQLRDYEKYVCDDACIELPEVYRGVGYGDCSLTSVIDDYLESSNSNVELSKKTRFTSSLSPESLLKIVLVVTNCDESALYMSKKNNLPRQLACYALRKLTQ